MTDVDSTQHTILFTEKKTKTGNPVITSLKKLSELPVNPHNLTFGLNFKHTLLPKAGFLNSLKGSTQSMDIDISCLLLDSSLSLIDVVWFKSLRDASQAIRHQGDSLNGKDRSDQALLDRHVDVETIELKLTQLPKNVRYLALAVSSYHGHPLKSVARGNVNFSDDEGNTIHEFDLTRLNHNSSAICVAVLSRQYEDWLCAIPMQEMSHNRADNMTDDIQKIVGKLFTANNN